MQILKMCFKKGNFLLQVGFTGLFVPVCPLNCLFALKTVTFLLQVRFTSDFFSD